MVIVDTVYQRVLALANKEQRGYITPQEFNLYANQAQMDIFEQYFYDLNQFKRIPGNNTVHSDAVSILEEKIAIFESSSTITTIADSTYDIFPGDFYRIGSISYTDSYSGNNVVCERISINDIATINSSPLLRPSSSRPVYVLSDNIATIYPYSEDDITLNYIKRPEKVNWTYMVVAEKALYNPNNIDHQNFELHRSEEADLVIKILQLAGIGIKDPGLYQIAGAEDNKSIQQEKQ